MMPPVRVAIARPMASPAQIVAGQVGTIVRPIAMMARVAQHMAARNGTSIGAKNRLP